MSFSAPQRALMLAARDLHGAGIESYDLARLQVQAKARKYPSADKITAATINGLVDNCKLSRRGAILSLTEAGRQRLREGLR